MGVSKVSRDLWGDGAEPPPRRFKVGDFVQWTSGGVDQFTEPRPIRGFHSDTHAYFEPDGKGIAPVSELTIMDPRTPTPPILVPIASPVLHVPVSDQVMIVEERFTLDEGPVTVRWPNKISADSYHDLEHHMKGLLARARRKAGIKPKETGD